jgi:mycothiol synthase
MSSTLQDRYTVRPADDGDLDAVVRLVGDADAAIGLPADPPQDFLIWIWHLSTTQMDRDTKVVTHEGAMAAYGQATWRAEDGGPLDLYARVHPDHHGAGIGAWFAEWAEALAEERGAEGVRVEVADRDETAHQLLRSRGYVQVRTMFTMLKTLGSNEVAPPAPPGVTIRGYSDADERVLYEVDQASFAEHWGFRPTSFETFNEMLHGEDWDPTLVFFAEEGGVVVGFTVSFSFAEGGYVAMLGVLEAWRGRGIAKALLRRAFSELANRGQHEVKLGVDASNPHGAVALYEGVGMTIFRRFDFFDLGTPEARDFAGPGV